VPVNHSSSFLLLLDHALVALSVNPLRYSANIIMEEVLPNCISSTQNQCDELILVQYTDMRGSMMLHITVRSYCCAVSAVSCIALPRNILLTKFILRNILLRNIPLGNILPAITFSTYLTLR
jgi:hypothetical protein